MPTGRDVSSTENSGPTGLMAGKRSLDGNNAAFDMKSLGKHIEAVSVLSAGTHTSRMWIPEHAY
jgi:dynamin 1-like protein